MEKNKDNFRKMNCEDCQCMFCSGTCMCCFECYRSEYAEEDFDDFYFPHLPLSLSCHKF